MIENKNSVENIPTVMPDSYQDFESKIEKVFRLAETIQIDVMDGRFVPSVSWPYNNQNSNDWQEILKQEKGIPHWDSCDFEIDLMVLNQVEEANNWIDAGVSRVIGHYEAFFQKTKDEQLSHEEIEKFINLKQERGVEVYLAISPNTDNSVLDKYLERIDGVQFMGIENVGFQGQPFAEKVLEKISELRSKMSDLQIAIDGGVNFETARRLVDAGVSKLSIGSLIFNSNDPESVLKELDSLK
jgi:ribulose-phosphate 3-epimerase